MERLITIIMPTWNGARTISRSIESILSQNYQNWELFIIDDGSSDNTEEIIKKYSDGRIFYFKNVENLGVQKTLNRGLKKAKGAYIARIDDDDLWVDPDKLKQQVDFLDSHANYVLVGTGVVVVDEAGNELFRYLVPTSDEDIRSRLLGKNCFVHSSVMFKKDKALWFGGYSEEEDAKHLEDYDLWLKLGTVGKLANLPYYSIKFTLRDKSVSSIHKIEIFKKIIHLIKKFRSSYPHYYRAVFRSVARLVVYGFILKSPIKFSLHRIIKIYKEN